MAATQRSVRWGIERRLEFIEFRLFWEGHVNCSDLMAAFGISINQASADLNRYHGTAPGNMVHDKSARTYVRGNRFEHLILKPDPARYLFRLRLKKLEWQQRRQRQEIFRIEDEIIEKRDQLIDQLEQRQAQRTQVETLFTIRWAVG